MPELYIHIGAHKAGSSSFQQALLENAYRLRTNGTRYLNSGRQHQVGPNYGLANAAKTWPSEVSRKTFKRLAAEIGRATETKFVVSAESFENLSTPNNLAPFFALKKQLGLEIVVLYLVRSHPNQINSSYVQQVREFQIDEPFPEYVQNRLAAYRSRYRRCIEYWTPVADRVVVKEFSPAAVEQFCHAEFGVPIKLGHQNKAVNVLAIEALRKKRSEMREKEPERSLRRLDNLKIIESMLARAVEFDDLFPRFWGLDDTLFGELAVTTEADCAFLREKFGIALADRPNEGLSMITSPYEADVAKIIHYITHG